jgi:protein ImuB
LRSRYEPDGWIIDDADGPIEEVIGPQVVSGGWWMREVQREYYYVRTRNGRWLWIYHDRRRRRWFLQGEVE